MRKLVIMILLLSLLQVTGKANRLKILWMNHPQLLINGKLAKVGDVFGRNDKITWAKGKPKQAMTVIDIDDNYKRYLVVANPTENNSESGLQILIRIKNLSTHDRSDGNDLQMGSFDRLEESLQSHYYLLDSITVPTDITVNENNYFLGSYKYGDTRISKRLPFQNGQIIIDKSLFHVDNKKLDPRDISLTKDYVVRTLDNTVFIKDNILLTIIPEKLE